MNVRDSQWLEACLERRGFASESLERADFVILNTCSVREKPEQKVLSSLRHIEQNCRSNTRIAIIGCVAQQLGESLFSASGRVCLVAGSDNLDRVPDILSSMTDGTGQRISLLEFSGQYRERENPDGRPCGPAAFVNIMQGCNNFCSYCIVPFTRGREKSRSLEAVLTECRAALASGAIDITLLGQNVNAWRGSGHDFSDLLRQVASLPGLKRLHFITPHPADMDKATIACFGELQALCPSLHLPLQAGSDHILSAMRRRYDSAAYLRLVEQLRSIRPDLALTTDLIVGFPGETEEDFQATLRLMKTCGFSSSYSFCYSDRPGTRACLMPDKIPAEIKQDRLIRLQALQEDLTEQWLAARVGSETSLLLEGPSRRNPEISWQGRDPYGICVHVDPENVPDDRKELLQVKITGAKRHCLTGVLS